MDFVEFRGHEKRGYAEQLVVGLIDVHTLNYQNVVYYLNANVQSLRFDSEFLADLDDPLHQDASHLRSDILVVCELDAVQNARVVFPIYERHVVFYLRDVRANLVLLIRHLDSHEAT